MSNDPDPEALQERVDELEATVQKMLPGRRAFLAAGAGAAVGAVGMQRASNVGEASDGTAVGQIGTSSEKVNVVAHDVTSDSVDTEATTINGGQPQSHQDGRIVIQRPGSGVNDSIDPSNHTNPINEAISQAVADSVILLPPEGVEQEDDLIYSKNGIAIQGPGNVRSPDEARNCIVKITNPSTAGMLVQANLSRVEWGGFALKGPGDDAAGPPALKVDGANGGQVNDCAVRPLIFRDWGGKAIEASGNSDKEFGNHWSQIVAFNVDPGGAPTIDLGKAPPSVYSSVQLYPSATHSGSNATGARVDAGGARFEYLGLGRACGKALSQRSDAANLSTGLIRYEPTAHQSEPFTLVGAEGRGLCHVEQIHLEMDQSTNRVYNIFGESANKYFGPVKNRGSGSGEFTINGEYMSVNADTFDVTGTGEVPIRTALTSGQVTNNSGGTLTQPVACLGDLSTVS